jgi:hypothetical protein
MPATKYRERHVGLRISVRVSEALAVIVLPYPFVGVSGTARSERPRALLLSFEGFILLAHAIPGGTLVPRDEAPR